MTKKERLICVILVVLLINIVGLKNIAESYYNLNEFFGFIYDKNPLSYIYGTGLDEARYIIDSYEVINSTMHGLSPYFLTNFTDLYGNLYNPSLWFGLYGGIYGGIYSNGVYEGLQDIEYAYIYYFAQFYPDPDNPEKAEWTFMVYLDGDNDLETDAINDFLEMAEVGSSSEVNILVQFDRIPGYDSRYGDWSTCKRFFITQGITPSPEEAIEDIGEINVGEIDSLVSFINWGINNYPAEQYALIFWNHGDGWRSRGKTLKTAFKDSNRQDEEIQIKKSLTEIRKKGKEASLPFKGVCSDDTNDGDLLLMSEIKSALNEVDIPPVLIGFDACLMGMIEVCYQISDTGANILVASEEVLPRTGWPYDIILGDLISNPHMSPAQLGASIVSFFESYYYDWTLSAVDLTNIKPLVDNVSSLVMSLQNPWFDEEKLKSRAQKVMEGIDMAIINNQHGSSWPGAYGLAIYFPQEWEYDINYNKKENDFAAVTLWDDFLTDFYLEKHGSVISRSIAASQKFGFREHMDLYDFCLKLSESEETNHAYNEIQIPNEFNGILETIIGFHADDEIWTYPLPFSFPFYGQNYNSINVSSNGFLDFVNTTSDYCNEIDGLIYNIRIAPLWTDFVGDVYVQQSSDNSICIRWLGYEYEDEDTIIDVEVVLFSDGRIQFNYGNGNISIWGCNGYKPTIGISAGDGINYHISSYNGIENLNHVDSILYIPVHSSNDI